MSQAVARIGRPSLITVAYLTIAIVLALVGFAIAAGSGPSELGVFDLSQAPGDQLGTSGNEGTGGAGGAGAGADGTFGAGDGSGLPDTGFALALPFLVGSLALFAGLALRRFSSRGAAQRSA